MFFLKGFIGQFIPSMQQTFTKVDSIDEEDPLENICTDEDLASEEPNVMVNIIKVKNSEVMSKYEGKVVRQMFPVLGTFAFIGGIPKSDYWDQVIIHCLFFMADFMDCPKKIQKNVFS